MGKARFVAFLLSIVCAGFPSSMPAQESATQETTQELAKKAQNPIADLISLPFQNNTDFGIDPGGRNKNTLNIQPVLPFDMGSVRLITRTIAPLVWQPDFSPPGGHTFGLGDINASFFFSPINDNSTTWGAGPILVFPTATDDALGSDKWSAGPTFVILTMPGHWVVGTLINNIWSFAGDEDALDVNFMTVQYFVNYNFPGVPGLYFSSAPIITANWEASEGNKWTVPLGGGVGKVFAIGHQRFNAQTQIFGNVVKPENGPDWQLRLQLQLLFPK